MYKHYSASTRDLIHKLWTPRACSHIIYRSSNNWMYCNHDLVQWNVYCLWEMNSASVLCAWSGQRTWSTSNSTLSCQAPGQNPQGWRTQPGQHCPPLSPHANPPVCKRRALVYGLQTLHRHARNNYWTGFKVKFFILSNAQQTCSQSHC